MKRIRSIVFLFPIFIFGFSLTAHAAQLSFVSDTITDSRPSLPVDHTIVFRVTTSVPASGRIVIGFPSQAFSFDPSMSYTDMDFSVSVVSPYTGFVSRTLGAVPDVATDGVSIIPGAGPLTITLSSGGGIAAGSYVRLLVGMNAPRGVYQIANPSLTGSYQVTLATYDASSVGLDYGGTVDTILPAVGVEANTDKVNPPVITNGMPSGTIPSNVSGVLLSLNTDTYANCRYATSSGVNYDDMINNFDHTSAATLHTTTVFGITEGITYTYYVRCVDFAGNENQSDYLLSFTAGLPTGTNGGGGSGGSAPPSGGGGGGGGGAPFPAGSAAPVFLMTGASFPGSSMIALIDGQKVATPVTVDSAGNFSIGFPSLTQGVHSFTLQVLDGALNPISSYTATITITQGTTNSITGIVMPPSASFVKNSVSPGSSAFLSGLSEPSSTVEIWVLPRNASQDAVKYKVPADTVGVWSYAVPTTGMAVDIYQVKVRSFPLGPAVSNFSNIVYLGVGQTPASKIGLIGDINGDGKVNLVDFSILLAHWGKSYAPVDFNGDGTVNLIDFSILLAHWTG